MNKKILAVIIFLSSVVAYIVVYCVCIRHTEVKIVEEPEELVSINRLICDSLSDLEATQSFDRAIERFMRRWEVTGASFALMRNDSLIYAKGYGYADVENGVKCSVANVFRLASVSKLITATAVMKLIEKGELSLDSKIFGQEGILCDSMFLELGDKSMEKITVEHLLRHTAGFATPANDPAFANYTVAQSLGKPLPITTDDMVAYSIRYRLRGEPGDRYDYSNLGYILLGKVVENVTGVTYESYVQDSVLAPIGCYDMFIGRNFIKNRADNEVKYYEVKEAETVEAYNGSGIMTMKSDGGNNVTLLGGAGGWVASPVELLKLVASIDGEGAGEHILNRESVGLMTDIGEGEHPIGWASVRDGDWLRSGSMSGTTALIKRQSDGYTWVFVTNKSPWIGYKLNNYASTAITRSISEVKMWPQRNLFEIKDL